MTAAAIAVSVLFWLGGITRLPSAIRAPSRRPLCAALLAFALALTFDIPPVYTAFDHAVGIPNLADLIEHSFAIIGVFALLRTLEQLTNAPSRRRSRILWILPIAAVAGSALLFAVASPRYEDSDFTDRYGQSPLIVAYWAITIGYFAVILIELARLVIRHSGRCRRTALRVGLRFVGAGVAVGVAYSLLKIGTETLAVSRTNIHRYVGWLDSAALVIGGSLIGIGLLLPALDTTWTAAATRLSDRLALLRLRRLWLDVTEHDPDIVLDGRRSLIADLTTRDPSFRLYRRVIEIRDAQLIAQASPDVIKLPRRSIELLRTADLLDSVNDQSDPSVRHELPALLELARVWPTPHERAGV
jgi:hypothetical protein